MTTVSNISTDPLAPAAGMAAQPPSPPIAPPPVAPVYQQHQAAPVAAPREMTFAEKLAAEKDQINREKDAAGRTIGVKRLTFIETHKITKLMGDYSANSTALTQAMVTAAVCEIDGDRVPFPTSDAQIEALMTRLDFHGIAAANKAHARFASVGENAEAETKN